MFNFDRAANFYDNTRGFPAGEDTPIAQLLVEAGELNTASRVLEVGIGTGRIAAPLAPYVQSVHGVDISALMMRKIKQKQDKGQIHPIQADALQLPYASHSFDVILLAHILHLLPDVTLAVKEISRVLKPDGRVLNCWNTDDKTFTNFRAIWSKFSDTKTQTSWRQVATCFDDNGWKKQPQQYSHTYIQQRIPQDFIEDFKNRVWSSTWRLSDEQITIAYQEMQTLIKAHFDDPRQPIDVSHTFYVTVYTK